MVLTSFRISSCYLKWIRAGLRGCTRGLRPLTSTHTRQSGLRPSEQQIRKNHRGGPGISQFIKGAINDHQFKGHLPFHGFRPAIDDYLSVRKIS